MYILKQFINIAFTQNTWTTQSIHGQKGICTVNHFESNHFKK